MASRTHQSGNTKIKVSTIHVNVLAYVEWGGKAWRKRRHSITVVWWKPWTWSGYEWRLEGTPPVSEVQFFGVDGDRIPDHVLNPSLDQSTGRVKVNAIYFFQSTGSGGDPTALGNDARSVANVKIVYSWDNETRTLSHN